MRVKLLATTMRALADDVRGRHLPRQRRRASAGARLRRGRGDVRHGRRRRAASPRRSPASVPTRSSRSSTSAPSRKTAALADVLARRDAARPRRRRDRPRRRPALDGRRSREQDADPDPARALTADTTFVVTGAAGSIVVRDHRRPRGRRRRRHVPPARPDPARRTPTTPTSSASRATATGSRSTHRPAAARRAASGRRRSSSSASSRGIERRRAALGRASTRSEAAGGTAHWHRCDLTDAAQVATAVDAARARDGGARRRSLHCAGLEISHFLPDKPQAEYDLVFDVKADGWFHLLHALGDRHPGTAVVFSSIAGRFGNGGQTDYSAANDLLCKSVSRMRRDGVTRGIAIDWTAWSGIGMASRGSIPKMMEVAGIDMLPPEHGVPVVRRELHGRRRRRRGRGRGRARHPARGAPPDRRARPRAVATAARARWPRGSPRSAWRTARSSQADLDPAREAFLDRPPHRRHSRCCRASWAWRASPRPRPPLLPGLAGRRARGRRPAGAAEVLPRRAAHARVPRAGARRRRRRRCSPTAA